MRADGLDTLGVADPFQLRGLTRFGLGVSKSDVIASQGDVQNWLFAQVSQPFSLVVPDRSSSQILIDYAQYRKARLENGANVTTENQSELRMATVGAGKHARWRIDAETWFSALVHTKRPYYERLVQFWMNYFTIRGRKADLRELLPAYRYEAIEQNIIGNFRTLLYSAVLHQGLLTDLDNIRSVGPNSIVGIRDKKGLNENLAREVLELYTLGSNGGYTQRDVEEVSLALTGWTVESGRLDKNGKLRKNAGSVLFHRNAHEPGERTVLSKRFRIDDGRGSQAKSVLDMLAAHPSTAANVARRLAAHFVSPGQGRQNLEKSVQDEFLRTSGDLKALYRILVTHPAVWEDRPLLTTPREHVFGVARLVKSDNVGSWGIKTLQALGQPYYGPDSPEGWGEAEEWGGASEMKQRLDAMATLSNISSDEIDPISAVEKDFSSLIADETKNSIRQAAEKKQAIAILLMAPEIMLR